MSQCVPSWDIDDPPPNPSPILHLHHYHPSGAPLYPLHSRTDYEVAELTWENGQLALHGLVPPRIGKPTPKYPPPSLVSAAAAWNKHHRSGTLESVVNQATGAAPLATPDFEEWFGGTRRSAAVDALVPCKDDVANNPDYPAAATGRKRARVAGVCSSQGSVAGSLAGRVDSTTLVTLGTCREDEIDLTTTATTATATISASPETETENTRVGKRKARALDDYVSISHTSSQTKHDSFYDEEGKATKRDVEKPCSSTKKSRAATIHNQSERKRRDKINQRMKTLQKLVPSSSKSDKASMLDEVIEYLKQLQAQVQMMSRMNNMMMPMAMPQLQMPMMPHMAHVTQLPQMAMGMGMGMMDPISISRSMPTALPLLHPFAFLPLPGAWDCSGDRRPSAAALPDPYSTLLACQMAQQQPMSLDEYSRMASLCQQLYQHQPQAKANPKS